MIYKAYAKVLGCRLKSHLPEIIHDDQSGFMEERCILDNVLTYWEACAITKQTRQETPMLMIDFEKDFDKISWWFLDKILQTMEFLDRWI